jgi:hypothetical protein
MPADGMRAAIYAKTEFRQPCLGSSKQVYPSLWSMESRYLSPLLSRRRCLLLALNVVCCGTAIRLEGASGRGEVRAIWR